MPESDDSKSPSTQSFNKVAVMGWHTAYVCSLVHRLTTKLSLLMFSVPQPATGAVGVGAVEDVYQAAQSTPQVAILRQEEEEEEEEFY